MATAGSGSSSAAISSFFCKCAHLCGHPHLSRSRAHHRPGGHPSSRGLYLPGFGNDHDHHVCRSRAHDAHPCEENNRHVHGETGMEFVRHGEGSAHDDHLELDRDHRHDRHHGLNQSAKMPKEGYGPTWIILLAFDKCSPQVIPKVPRSSAHHLSQVAYCASHGRRRLHRGDSHTPRRQTYLSC